MLLDLNAFYCRARRRRRLSVLERAAEVGALHVVLHARAEVAAGAMHLKQEIGDNVGHVQKGDRGRAAGAHLHIHAEQEVLENFVVAALVAEGLNQIALRKQM